MTTMCISDLRVVSFYPQMALQCSYTSVQMPHPNRPGVLRTILRIRGPASPGPPLGPSSGPPPGPSSGTPLSSPPGPPPGPPLGPPPGPPPDCGPGCWDSVSLSRSLANQRLTWRTFSIVDPNRPGIQRLIIRRIPVLKPKTSSKTSFSTHSKHGCSPPSSEYFGTFSFSPSSSSSSNSSSSFSSNTSFSSLSNSSSSLSSISSSSFFSKFSCSIFSISTLRCLKRRYVLFIEHILTTRPLIRTTSKVLRQNKRQNVTKIKLIAFKSQNYVVLCVIYTMITYFRYFSSASNPPQGPRKSLRGNLHEPVTKKSSAGVGCAGVTSRLPKSPNRPSEPVVVGSLNPLQGPMEPLQVCPPKPHQGLPKPLQVSPPKPPQEPRKPLQVSPPKCRQGPHKPLQVSPPKPPQGLGEPLRVNSRECWDQPEPDWVVDMRLYLEWRDQFDSWWCNKNTEAPGNSQHYDPNNNVYSFERTLSDFKITYLK
ncbi:LOW QUALITY PROTEIN: uncharacterized protein AB9W97_012854 [Spinachia spinachia]